MGSGALARRFDVARFRVHIKFFPVRLKKFPVPLRREFAGKPLI
jgi:hypothetical protein